jgi:hypothetical protein
MTAADFLSLVRPQSIPVQVKVPGTVLVYKQHFVLVPVLEPGCAEMYSTVLL